MAEAGSNLIQPGCSTPMDEEADPNGSTCTVFAGRTGEVGRGTDIGTDSRRQLTGKQGG